MFSAVSVCQFVCQCVCQFVCTITSERLNVGRSNLAVRYTVQKFRPNTKVKIKRQRHQGQKKRKTAESSPLTMHSRACIIARPYAACCNRRYHCVPPGGDGLRQWENQLMLSSIYMQTFVACMRLCVLWIWLKGFLIFAIIASIKAAMTSSSVVAS